LKETTKKHENWRDEQWQQEPGHQQKRDSKEQEIVQEKEVTQQQKASSGNHVAGILVIPSQAPDHTVQQNHVMGFCQSQDQSEYPGNFPAFRGCIPNPLPFQQQQQRQLFDPNNPSKPIIVSSPGARAVQSLHSRLNIDNIFYYVTVVSWEYWLKSD
jgi:hypothetical protein